MLASIRNLLILSLWLWSGYELAAVGVETIYPQWASHWGMILAFMTVTLPITLLTILAMLVGVVYAVMLVASRILGPGASMIIADSILPGGMLGRRGGKPASQESSVTPEPPPSDTSDLQ